MKDRRWNRHQSLECVKLLRWDPNELPTAKYPLYPPVLFLNQIKEARRLFRNPVLPKVSLLTFGWDMFASNSVNNYADRKTYLILRVIAHEDGCQWRLVGKTVECPEGYCWLHCHVLRICKPFPAL